MTTLTVYFALSPTSVSSSSSSATSTKIQQFQMISNRIKSTPIAVSNVTLPSPSSSSSSFPTPPERQILSKRNKTFFERFDQIPSASLSQQQQQQLQNDSSNPSSDPQPRLRRRFTFRRSLRQSMHNKKGRDIDDGISFDVDGSSSPRGILNSHHNISTSSHYHQHGIPNAINKTTTTAAAAANSSSGMHRRESFLYKCDSDNDLSPKCISRNPSIGSEL